MDERTPARGVLVRARACARVLCVCVLDVYVCFLRLRFRVCWVTVFGVCFGSFRLYD